jgi:Ca2+-transporting ATPase
VATLAIAIAASCLLLACWLAALHRPWQTPLFCALAMGQLGVALTARSAVRPVWRTPPSGNPFLYVAVAGSVLAIVAAVWVPPLAALLGTVPPSASDLAWVLVAASVPAVVVELMKARRRHGARKRHDIPTPVGPKVPPAVPFDSSIRVGRRLPRATDQADCGG